MSGTSMATPHVALMAAFLRSYGLARDAEECRQLLKHVSEYPDMRTGTGGHGALHGAFKYSKPLFHR